MLNETVELVLSVLVFVLLSADSDTDLSGNVSDASAPQEPVKAGVNADVLGEHFSFCEFSDLSNCTRSSLLELDFVESLVEIDGVISGHGLDLLLLSFLHTRHFLSFSNIII